MRNEADRAIESRARGQHGVFTYRQAREAGHSPRMIRRRLESRAWMSLHQMVYTFASTPPSWHRDEMAACFWAKRGRNGCGVLRRLVHERIGLVEPPNSGLETVIFEMIKASTLPLPSLQVVIRDIEGRFVARPDFLYPADRLIVQGHSKQWHWGVAAESKDLEQHNALCALGYRVLYLTWSDATRHADRTVMTIGRMLSGAAA